MARILFVCAVLGVLFAGWQVFRQETDTKPTEQLDELKKQTELTAELLSIQKQLLAVAQSGVEMNQRIADIELRVSRMEAGPSRGELEAELAVLRDQLLDNTVRQDDLEYRLNDILVELKRLGVDTGPYILRQRPTPLVIVDPPTDPPPPPTEPPDEGPVIVLEAWDSQDRRWDEEEVVLPPEDVCTTLHWRTEGIAEVFLEHVGHGPVPGTGEVGVGERLACIESDDRSPEQWILHVKLRDSSWVERTLVLRGY